jgi:two-component system chemotaxis sensor kinase CheA
LARKSVFILWGKTPKSTKTILENVIDPLVHIVRNAVDHGIESPEQRTASGKAPEGRVTLSAYHQGNNLVIEVIDDGKGMDPNVIREKALEKGVLQPGHEISDSEALQLLFHPGFSTKEQVSEVSGRGVGMDVVKTNIVNLGGEVLLSSEVGKGSQCRIQLPLTLAIIDGMVARVGEERFIFPLSQIREFLRPTREMISHITGVGMCLSLRGHVMPVFDLSRELLGRESQTALGDSICVVCSVHNSFFCVQVQDILNQQQIVVKALSPDIKNQMGFMGGSILGDGQPAFIVDIEELYRDRVKEIRGQSSLKEGA